MHPTAVLIDRFRRTYLKVKEGPKHLHVVPMAGAKVVKLTPKECEELALRELDYPLDKALAHFRAAAERLGLGTEVGALFAQPPRPPAVAPQAPGPREAASGAAAQLTLLVAPHSQETTSWTEHASTPPTRSKDIPPAAIQTTGARAPQRRRRETTRSRTPTTGRRATSP